MTAPKYRIGNLCDGETRWSNQFVEPRKGQVTEEWGFADDGTPHLVKTTTHSQWKASA